MAFREGLNTTEGQIVQGVNKAIIVGRVGQEPTTRYTKDGKAVTSFSVATSEQWKDKQGEKQARTEWHNVVCFGRLAEVAGEFLGPGSKVYIEGKLSTSSYEKNGEKRYSTNIQARELQMLGERAKSQPQQQAAPQPTVDSSFDDDIPF